MTLRKITEQRVTFKFCVAEGTFSNETIKHYKKQKLIFKKNIAKVYSFIVYEKCPISLWVNPEFG